MLTFDCHTTIQLYNVLAVELLARHPVCGVDRHAEVLTRCEPHGRQIPSEENPLLDALRTGDPLRNRHVLSERVGMASAIIDRQSAQMVRPVDVLLDVSRISRGTIDLRREMFRQVDQSIERSSGRSAASASGAVSCGA